MLFLVFVTDRDYTGNATRHSNSFYTFFILQLFVTNQITTDMEVEVEAKDPNVIETKESFSIECILSIELKLL